MGKIKAFPGQVSVWSFFESYDAFRNLYHEDSVVTDAVLSETGIPGSEESYLVRSERLLSLAKDRYQRFMKGYELSTIEEKIFALEVGSFGNYSQIKDHIAKKVVRPYLCKIEKWDDSDESYKELMSMIDFDITLRATTEEENRHRDV